MINKDTICAISTAPGMGAVALVRVSGADAISICNINVATLGDEGTFVIRVKAVTTCDTTAWYSQSVTVQAPFSVSGFELIPNMYFQASMIPNPLPNMKTINWYINGVQDNAMTGQYLTMANIVQQTNVTVEALVTTTTDNCTYRKGVTWNSGAVTPFSLEIDNNSKSETEITTFTLRNTASENVTSSALETISVYPNPASNYVTIGLPDAKASNIFLFSADGKIVMKDSSVSSVVDLDLSSVDRGTYVIVIIQEGKKYSKNLIVNK